MCVCACVYCLKNKCIQQECNPNEYNYLLQKSNNNNATNKTTKLTTIEKIITWANKTTSHNSILILIENPECISKQVMNMILSIISSFRCVHGIPVGIVYLSISDELVQGDLLCNYIHTSCLNGQVGIVVNEFNMVRSRVLVGTLCQYVIIILCI